MIVMQFSAAANVLIHRDFVTDAITRQTSRLPHTTASLVRLRRQRWSRPSANPNRDVVRQSPERAFQYLCPIHRLTTLGWMQQRVSFDEAKTRAFLAVNDAFSTALNLSTGLDFDQLDLHSAGETHDHATLFALSSLLLLAADGSNPDGLNQLLERLSRRIRDTARMSSEDHAALREAARRLRPEDVVAGLNSFASGRTPIPLDALDSVIDSDLDGQVNAIDADDDEDGLADSDELQAGSDQLNADSDGDGLPDGRDAAPVLFELVVPDQQLDLQEDSSAVININAVNGGLAQGFSVVQQPTLGSLTGTFPEVTYIPAPNRHGTEEFRYTLRRDSYTSRVVSVRIRIEPVPVLRRWHVPTR